MDFIGDLYFNSQFISIWKSDKTIGNMPIIGPLLPMGVLYLIMLSFSLLVTSRFVNVSIGTSPWSSMF